MRDTAAVTCSAMRFGIRPLAKSAYVMPKALAWAQQSSRSYDHVLAYWGNYAGTCAYLFHRLQGLRIPFSLFVHAGIDLYHDQVYMREKLRYADNIVTCSAFNREYIKDQFPDVFNEISEKIYVHHHGLDFATLSYEPRGRLPQRVIAVGMLETYKGFDYLIRAARELISRGRNIEIELIGDGKQRDSLKDLANELGLGDRLRFRGLLRPEEVHLAMQQATILVHPSNGLNDGVPNVIKEAMAVGTPVVASDVAGIPELLGNGQYGMLVPTRDTTALANAMEILLTDDALRRRFADAARQHVETNFDLWRAGELLADRLRSSVRLNRN